MVVTPAIFVWASSHRVSHEVVGMLVIERVWVNVGAAVFALVVRQTPPCVPLVVTVEMTMFAELPGSKRISITRWSVPAVIGPMASFVKVGLALVALVDLKSPRIGAFQKRSAPTPPMPEPVAREITLASFGSTA